MAALELSNDGIDALFPPEIWIHVFSFLPTRDLHALLLVDRAFYRFAVPLLYESVYWKTEPRGLLRVLSSSRFLIQDTNNLIGRVRKCTVLKGDDRRCRQTSMPWDSVSPHHSRNSIELNPLFDFPLDAPPDVVSDLFASLSLPPFPYQPPPPPPLYILANAIGQMVNLTTLVLGGVVLVDTLVAQLPALQSLHDITITNCSIEGLNSAGGALIATPPAPVIRMVIGGNKETSTTPSILSRLYDAVISPHLTHLSTTVDSLRGIAAAFEALSEPPTLRSLEVTYHSRSDQSARRLISFAERFGHAVTHLAILEATNEACDDLRQMIPSHPQAFPNLSSYYGPSSLVAVLQPGRPLQDIRIRDIVHAPRWPLSTETITMLLTQAAVQAQAGLPYLSLSPWLDDLSDSERTRRIEEEMGEYKGKLLKHTIHQFSVAGINLRKLECEIMRWDEDLLWMLVQHQPQVRDLRIACTSHGPDEQFYLSFWGCFLDRFPCLESFHVYDLSLKPDEGISLQDQRFAIRMITKRSQVMREIAMVKEVVWKRMGENVGWVYLVDEEGAQPLTKRRTKMTPSSEFLSAWLGDDD